MLTVDFPIVPERYSISFSQILYQYLKINIGTTLRQAYEEGKKESVSRGRDMVYRKAVWLLTEELKIAGSKDIVNPD